MLLHEENDFLQNATYYRQGILRKKIAPRILKVQGAIKYGLAGLEGWGERKMKSYLTMNFLTDDFPSAKILAR